MLELFVGIGLGVAAVVYTHFEHRQALSHVQSLLDDERRQNADLQDRLAAKTWPEYKEFASTAPPVDPYQGLVWVGSDDGMMGDWLPPEEAARLNAEQADVD